MLLQSLYLKSREPLGSPRDQCDKRISLNVSRDVYPLENRSVLELWAIAWVQGAGALRVVAGSSNLKRASGFEDSKCARKVWKCAYIDSIVMIEKHHRRSWRSKGIPSELSWLTAPKGRCVCLRYLKSRQTYLRRCSKGWMDRRSVCVGIRRNNWKASRLRESYFSWKSLKLLCPRTLGVCSRRRTCVKRNIWLPTIFMRWYTTALSLFRNPRRCSISRDRLSSNSLKRCCWSNIRRPASFWFFRAFSSLANAWSRSRVVLLSYFHHSFHSIRFGARTSCRKVSMPVAFSSAFLSLVSGF